MSTYTDGVGEGLPNYARVCACMHTAQFLSEIPDAHAVKMTQELPYMVL